MASSLNIILRRQSVSWKHSSYASLQMLILATEFSHDLAGQYALFIPTHLDPDSDWLGSLDYDPGLLMSTSNSETTVFSKNLLVDPSSTVSCCPGASGEFTD